MKKIKDIFPTDTLRDSAQRRIDNARTRIFNRAAMVKNGHQPFDVLYDDGFATLRHYTHCDSNADTPKEVHKTPLLIIPPLAVSSKIYDLLEHRSFIAYMLKQGFDVYMIDWGVPTRRDSQRGFDYYVTKTIPRMIRAVREYSNSQDISLHGWSMGGLFTILHAAYSKDPHIKNLFLVGVPIDSHASGILGKMVQVANTVSEKVEHQTGFHVRKLPNPVIHIPGWMNMMMFKAIDPIGMTKSYWHLLKSLDDKSTLVENATKTDFLNHMMDYPGAVIRDTAIHFLLTNGVIKGEFKLNGKDIHLSDITANLFVIAGKTDTLATTRSVEAIMNHVSSKDKTFVDIPGGHVGIISSQITAERTWPYMAKWLAERS